MTGILPPECQQIWKSHQTSWDTRKAGGAKLRLVGCCHTNCLGNFTCDQALNFTSRIQGPSWFDHGSWPSNCLGYCGMSDQCRFSRSMTRQRLIAAPSSDFTLSNAFLYIIIFPGSSTQLPVCIVQSSCHFFVCVEAPMIRYLGALYDILSGNGFGSSTPSGFHLCLACSICGSAFHFDLTALHNWMQLYGLIRRKRVTAPERHCGFHIEGEKRNRSRATHRTTGIHNTQYLVWKLGLCCKPCLRPPDQQVVWNFDGKDVDRARDQPGWRLQLESLSIFCWWSYPTRYGGPGGLSARYFVCIAHTISIIKLWNICLFNRDCISLHLRWIETRGNEVPWVMGSHP